MPVVSRMPVNSDKICVYVMWRKILRKRDKYMYVCKNGVEQLLRINSVSGTSFWKRQDAFHTNW